MDSRAYRDLETWQRGMMLVERCYRVTASFPKGEMYGLTSQLRRAAVSIPSNVAEGYCRRNTKVYANHVSIALGSPAEVETCIELARRLGFIADEEGELEQTTVSVGRLLSGLFRSLLEKVAHDETRGST